MAARCGIEGATRRSLAEGWRFVALPPGQAEGMAVLTAAALDWIDAPVPGTAAQALQQAGRWSHEQPLDFDALDGFWHCRFKAESSSVRHILHLEGLATVAEVWLNGECLLRSDNQFHAHAIEVTGRLRGENELLIHCRALAPLLKARRPRPRWRTKLVAQQSLRWFRTTLLGRIPGWSPPVAPLGPWRPVWLETLGALVVTHCHLQATPVGTGGTVLLEAVVQGAALHAAHLQVAGVEASLTVTALESGHWQVRGTLTLPTAERWWPHTHGAQPRYPVTLRLRDSVSATQVELGPVAFRTLALDTRDEGFALSINEVPVFCRGACWTTEDIVRLGSDPARMRVALEQARDAGFNLLRVGGTMVYETNAFYEACDQLGLLVWQDFMFANMDYPADDPAFHASVETEVRQFLDRTQTAACLAVLCGNSEIEQQAAMLGFPREHWSGPLFQQWLPQWSQQLRPDVPYWPSSPSGGALPFQVDAGVSHYYGVGAYLRPMEDARRAGVRFTSECLAFANVPEPDTLEALLADGETPPHHPKWKARVPRDSGPGWDFDDVRDHYLAALYGVDPARLRYADVDRYLYLSRLVSAEVMAQTMSEWRRVGSSCRGALLWFFRDLWPGAGWGLVDANGLPKAAWYGLRRACAPVALLLTDEGLNGLALHAVNDGGTVLDTRCTLTVYRDGETVVAQGQQGVQLPAHGAVALRGDAVLGHFTDLTQAYRFGPSGHDVVVARLHEAATDRLLGEAVYLPRGLGGLRQQPLGWQGWLEQDVAGDWWVQIGTRAFAQSVWIEARGYRCEDNYFHLTPGASRRLRLSRHADAGRARSSPPQVVVHAVNAPGSLRLTLA